DAPDASPSDANAPPRDGSSAPDASSDARESSTPLDSGGDGAGDVASSARWARRFGGPGPDNGFRVALDGKDAVLLTGSIRTSADLGAGPFTVAGGGDAFVAKYAPSGEPMWSKHFGSTDASASTGGFGVRALSSGDVVVSGAFDGSVDFGGGAIASAGGGDAFLARFGADGAHVWSHGFGDAGADDGYAIAVDAGGDVVIAGKFQQNVDFGGGASLTSAGANDAFVARLASTDGATRWAKRFGAASQDRAWEIAVGA